MTWGDGLAGGASLGRASLLPLIPVGRRARRVDEPRRTRQGCVDFVLSLPSVPWAKVTELCLYVPRHPVPSAGFFVNKPQLPDPCPAALPWFPPPPQFSLIAALGNNMRKLCRFTPSDLISLDAFQIRGINHT